MNKKVFIGGVTGAFIIVIGVIILYRMMACQVDIKIRVVDFAATGQPGIHGARAVLGCGPDTSRESTNANGEATLCGFEDAEGNCTCQDKIIKVTKTGFRDTLVPVPVCGGKTIVIGMTH